MRRWFAVVLAASLAAGVLSEPSFASPPHTLLLEGHGWGHAVGMGQWGARGMASSGAKWPTILTHYYTGVRIDAMQPRQSIRVRLSTQRSVVLTADRNFRAAWRDADLAIAAHRFLLVQRRTRDAVIGIGQTPNGPWHLLAYAPGHVSVGGAAIATVAPGGAQRLYRGAFVLQPDGAQLDVIDVVSMEDYLLGVVPREMPAAWPMQALRAQAVAARTYAERVRAHARTRHTNADICDDTRCQVYGGAARRYSAHEHWSWLESPRSTAAVRATARRIMTWHGQPILAEYSSSTGGTTESGGAPYLRAVSDPGDAASPFHVWAQEITAHDVQAVWPSIGRFLGVRVLGRDGNGDWGGRVSSVRVEGTAGSVRVSGGDFAAVFGLRSRWFRVIGAPSHYLFRHNLGYGAHDLAVFFLQLRLRAEGFFPGDETVTSYFGGVTRAAVVGYQRAHGLSATGFVGAATRAALNKSRAPRRRFVFTFDMGAGTTNVAVKRLQQRLRAEGFYPRRAPITDYFGNITRRALQRYQRAHRIEATGYLGPRTRARLNGSA